MRKRVFIFLLKILVDVCLLAGLVWYAGLEECWTVLKGCRLVPLLISVLLIAGALLAGVLATVLLGQAVNSQLGWRDGFKGYLSAWLLSLFFGQVATFSLPVFWRPYLTPGQTLAVVVVGKLITLVWVVCLAALGIGVLFHPQAGIIAGAVGGGGLLLLVLIVASPWTRTLVSRIMPRKLYELLRGGMDTFRHLGLRGRAAVLANFLLIGLRLILHGGTLSALLASVGARVDVADCVMVQAATYLGAMVPISLMGLGIMESIWVTGLRQVGVGAPTVMGAAVLGRLVIFTLLVPAVFLVSRKRKSELEEKSEDGSAGTS